MIRTPDEITAESVVALLREQHPDLADLPVKFAASGWDNQLWRLGEELAVRLPWATDDASELLLKEYSLVPRVAADLPLRTPVPQRLGQPTEAFPHSWIVTTWVPGEPADRAPVTCGDEAADILAAFLVALHQPAPADAPVGRHRRGGVLADSAGGFDYFLGDAIERGLIPDSDAVRKVWDDAVAAPAWTGPPVWLHADLHPANLLTSGGVFCGVIDFGDLCAGDPACDLASGWLLLPEGALDRFHAGYGSVDEATLRRARGWALLKALACLVIGDNGDRGLPGGKPTWGLPAKAALRRLVA
ncbi:aminoglycoside phosphotransferase family protein [Streptomyces sp. NPDC003480]